MCQGEEKGKIGQRERVFDKKQEKRCGKRGEKGEKIGADPMGGTEGRKEAYLGIWAIFTRAGRPKSKERRRQAVRAGPRLAAALISLSAAFTSCGTVDPSRRYSSLFRRATSCSARLSKSAAVPADTWAPCLDACPAEALGEECRPSMWVSSDNKASSTPSSFACPVPQTSVSTRIY